MTEWKILFGQCVELQCWLQVIKLSSNTDPVQWCNNHSVQYRMFGLPCLQGEPLERMTKINQNKKLIVSQNYYSRSWDNKQVKMLTFHTGMHTYDVDRF